MFFVRQLVLVRLSRFSFKFLMNWSPINLKLSTHVPYDRFNLNAKFRVLTQLNIEMIVRVYYGQIRVCLFLCPTYICTMSEEHNVFWSVLSFGCPSVSLRVKGFGQRNFWWSWSLTNLKLSTHVSYDMNFQI